ncbi:SANT/Myb-like DNA-binding domain-containing protein [Bradyrhizobium sp. USDA 4473]
MAAGSWSAEEEHRLLQLIRKTGLTQREIAQKLGRTEAAVVARLTIVKRRASAGDAAQDTRRSETVLD